MTLDFTKGNIIKNLFVFLIPVLIGNFFQQLYTTVDALIIGKYVGKNGLASIDAVLNVIRIPTVFLIGLSVGGTILISQYYGARKYKKQKNATHTLVAFSFVSGIFFSIFGYIITPHILSMLKLPIEIYKGSLIYTQISFLGLVFVMIYNIGSGILRAIGDSKTPFYILFVCCIVNIVLDIYFVARIGLGVSGVAIATLIAQAVSSILVMYALLISKSNSKIILNEIRIKYTIFLRMLKIGIPIGLQSVLYPLANILIQTRINQTGTDNIAAWALTGKIDGVVWIILDSLTQATITFVAQNYGANKIERIKIGIRKSLLISCAIMIGISILLNIYSKDIAYFFINDDIVVDLTIKILNVLIPFYFFFAIGDILSCGIRGTGQTLAPTVITLVTSCLFRILWVFFAVNNQNDVAIIILIFPITWILNCVVFVVYYYYYKKIKL